MQGLMMDVPLSLPAILRRTDAIFGGKPLTARRADRTIALAILGIIVLAVLLVCLRWGVTASGAASALLAGGALVAALVLYWIVSHLE